MRQSNIISKFTKNEDGASLIYVTITLGFSLAFVGLAIDMSRLSGTHTQAQSAADAAAIAAARQLDGGTDAITRATNAAINTPIVSNSQRFADETDKSSVTISSIRFFDELPSSDDTLIPGSMETTDPLEAKFAEVTTETLNHQNLFLPIVGIEKTTAISGVAVAGSTSLFCKTVYLATCNPAEFGTGSTPGAEFNYTQWIGKQYLLGGSGSAPGFFSLLDAPDSYGQGQNPNNIAEWLADEVDPTCTSTRLDVSPGNKEPIDNGLNTRFDMYPNGGGADITPTNSPPAANISSYPRDSNLPTGAPTGNGVWDCASYWSSNHSGAYTGPGTCTSTESSTTRYEVYQHENTTGPIPANGMPTNTPSIDSLDRRVLNFAVVNCEEHSVSGNSGTYPSEAFVSGFLTEPVSGSGSDPNIYLEIIDAVKAGEGSGGEGLHEFVEILR